MNNERNNLIGNISEIRVLGKLIEKGYSVSLPFGSKERYDFIIDTKDGALIKAQVKTGNIRHNSIYFAVATRKNWKDGSRTQNYRGQIDLFLVYVPALDKVYRIPIELVTNTTQFSIQLYPHERATRPDITKLQARDFEL